MSQENVEIVRQSIEAFDGGLDNVAKFWHPEISWRAIEGALDDIGVFEGPEAMRRYYEQWYETFERLRVEAEKLIDGGDQVVAAVCAVGQMKGSGAEVEMRLATVSMVRDGLIVWGREYATLDEALKAAGLSE